MALTGHVTPAPAGILGFDTAEPLNAIRAKQFFNRGYRFCVRYVGHAKFKTGHVVDLVHEEAQDIVDAGLALMVVQHPLVAGWTPTVELGRSFGQFAAANAGAAALPTGVNVWLDLEGVKSGTPAEDTIAFCNAWFAAVAAVGYETGVYIGANPGLSADQLYWDLKTAHYWKGGSSAKDQQPKPGYIVLYNWEGGLHAEHIGWVESLSGGGLDTIEFNTTATTGPNQGNGGSVARKTRALTFVLGYVTTY